jgi:hypothetical protein
MGRRPSNRLPASALFQFSVLSKLVVISNREMLPRSKRTKVPPMGKRTRKDQVRSSKTATPNAATVRAMKEARRGKLKSSRRVGDLMADLNAEVAAKPRRGK